MIDKPSVVEELTLILMKFIYFIFKPCLLFFLFYVFFRQLFMHNIMFCAIDCLAIYTLHVSSIEIKFRDK